MRKILLAAVALLLLTLQLVAQNKTITGKITNATDGSPLAGVTVQAKGTNLYVQSGPDGLFNISIPPSVRALIFTSVGLASQEIQLGNRISFSVALSPQANSLNEVVVTALGITKDRRSLGYATQNIKNEEIVDKGEVNIVNALQGKVAGVDITGASGSAGASANINIRGFTSFNGSNQPLFVVDGTPISNDVDRTGNTLMDHQPPNRALDLNINEIESVNVLKGPAAAVLYGSRAASGAIIITTKRGTGGRGKVKVTFATSYSQQRVAGLYEFQNEYGQGAGGLYDPVSVFSYGPKIGSTPTLSNGLLLANGQTADYRAYPSNIIDFFETGRIAENSINVNGGDARQNFNFSLANTDQKGILPNTSLDRTNVGVKFNTDLSDKFSLGASINYISSKQVGITHGNGASSALFQLFSVPRTFNLQAYKTNYKNPDGSNNWPLNNTRDNPYFGAYENTLDMRVSRTIANVKLGYDIVSWLNVSYRLGIDAYTDRRKKIIAVGSAAAGGLGSVLEDIFYRSELNGDLLITARKENLFVNDLDVTLLVGQNINNRVYQNAFVQSDSLSIPGFYNVDNGSQLTGSGEINNKRRLLGYYAQASFAYRNYLFVELTGRADQSSTLPVNKNTYFYPSISSSFVFTDAFKMTSDVLNYGKVRASFARVGKDADPNLLDNTYVVGAFGNNVAQFTFPLAGVPGWEASSRIADDNLSPEFTTSYEVGANLGFLKNRLSFDVAFFKNESNDLIVDVGIAGSTGYNTKTSNIGEMVTKGFEILVTGTPVSTRDFRWDITANFTRIRNEVIAIGGGVTSFSIAGNRFTGALPSIVEGQPYGVVLGNKWQRSPDGQFLINPSTGTFLGTIAGEVIADPNRDFIAGLTNTLKYKNITLSFLFDHKQGGDLVSWGAIAFRSNGSLKVTGVEREQPRILPGVIQTPDGKYVPNNIQIPAQTYWNSLGATTGAGDLGVFDATVLRLREVSLSIDIQNMFARKVFQNARFTLFGRNLWMYAPNSPFDTEINTQGAGNIRGFEFQSTPNTRTIGASFRITF